MAYKKLPDSELEIMRCIWLHETPTHIGEIMERLDPGKKRPYQAVQTLLGRLVEKGFLRCEKLGRLNYYTPLVELEAYRNSETASFVERMYANSPVRLIAALVRDTELSDQERDEIRRILEKGGE